MTWKAMNSSVWQQMSCDLCNQFGGCHYFSCWL